MSLTIIWALVSVALVSVLLAVPALRRRNRASRRPARAVLDTVQAWPPESARVMSIRDRQGYDLLRRALPGFLVLAQVPLARFIRVPTRHSYTDWLQRVGALSADLLLCDSGSRVLAVIEVRPAQESERSQRRHDRLARVLKAAGIGVHVWREGALPSMADVRASIGRQLGAPTPATASAGITQMLAAGDAAYDAALEPVPSAFFDETDERETARG